MANENITVVRHAPVLELIADGDVVTSALADHYGANLTVNAKAVVVACGGFDRSKEYMAKYVPNSDGVPSMSSCGNTGDEIAWAEALDAVLMFKGGVMGMHTTDASYTLTGTINLLSFLPTLGVNDKGEDEDFGRAGIYPLSDEGPYYAIKVIRSTVAGFGGFMINTDAQVLKNEATRFLKNWFRVLF